MPSLRQRAILRFASLLAQNYERILDFCSTSMSIAMSRESNRACGITILTLVTILAMPPTHCSRFSVQRPPYLLLSSMCECTSFVCNTVSVKSAYTRREHGANTRKAQTRMPPRRIAATLSGAISTWTALTLFRTLFLFQGLKDDFTTLTKGSLP